MATLEEVVAKLNKLCPAEPVKTGKPADLDSLTIAAAILFSTGRFKTIDSAAFATAALRNDVKRYLR